MIVIKAGTLIDGTGKEPEKNVIVVVEGGTITRVGTPQNVDVPPAATILDVSDKTVMPGMIDCHCHPSLTTSNIEKRLFTPKTVELFQTARNLKRILYAGFTTIRDAGTLNDIGFQQAVQQDLLEGPRIVLAGALCPTGGHFDEYYPHDVHLPFFEGEICDGVPEVRKAVRKLLRKGFDFIKVCTSGGCASPTDSPEDILWSLEELKTIIDEASAKGKAVMAHAEGTQGIKNAIRGGVWSLEHGDLLDEEAVQMLLDTGTYLVPTLTVSKEMLEHGEEMGLSAVALKKAKRLGQSNIESFKMASAAGVKIACGTDIIYQPDHGENARELEMMVNNGFTPMESLVAATKTAAEVCRINDKVGTIKQGKLADLLVVDDNPLDDISILQDKARILVVMKGGVIYVNRMESNEFRDCGVD